MSDEGTKLEGGCMCGAIRYAVAGTPTYAGNCHCRDCQRAIGAGIVTWFGARPEDMSVTKGHITYCETSAGIQRGFCGRCGSSLTFSGEGWNDIGVTAASLDDPSAIIPESNVFLLHKQPWIIADMTLRNYQEFP